MMPFQSDVRGTSRLYRPSATVSFRKLGRRDVDRIWTIFNKLGRMRSDIIRVVNQCNTFFDPGPFRNKVNVQGRWLHGVGISGYESKRVRMAG